jgi:phage terminase large subunit
MAADAADDEIIALPYGPRSIFVPYHMRTQRWAVLVAHRRAGKTVACINDVIARALNLAEPYGRYAYVAPFLAQAKEVAWEYLKRFAGPALRDKNESELWVELVNGARIRIHGADNPDRLRGAYLDGVVLDEYADMRPSVWGEVIRPMLADREGWATFIGTPKGRNEFFQIWDHAQADRRWFAAMLKASQTKLIPQAELDDARGDMTPEQYAQEFECSFEAAILGAYFGKEIAEAERAGRIADVPYDDAIPVHTGWDLGIGDSTAIWFFQVVGEELHYIDHYEAHGQKLDHYLAVLNSKPYRYGYDFLPHDAKARELISGRSRVEHLAKSNRPVRVLPQTKIEDGINAARLIIPRSWFDRDKCADGLEALRQYRADYDEKTKAFKDRPRHDWASHSADGFKATAIGYRELTVEDAPPDPIAELLKPRTFNSLMDELEHEEGRING